MNANNVMSFVHAVPPLVPSETKGGFLRKGLGQVRGSAYCQEPEQTCMTSWELASMAPHVTFHEQRQHKSQKHFKVRSLKSQLSKTLAENRNGSATVVQYQPHETKGSTKINVSDEKERMHLFPLLFQGAQEIGRQSQLSVTLGVT